MWILWLINRCWLLILFRFSRIPRLQLLRAFRLRLGYFFYLYSTFLIPKLIFHAVVTVLDLNALRGLSGVVHLQKAARWLWLLYLIVYAKPEKQQKKKYFFNGEAQLPLLAVCFSESVGNLKELLLSVWVNKYLTVSSHRFISMSPVFGEKDQLWGTRFILRSEGFQFEKCE